MALENPSFETGTLTGWTVQAYGNSSSGPTTVVAEAGYADSGSNACKIGASSDASYDTVVINNYKFYPAPGSTITVAARARSTKDKKGNAFASIGLKYTYADGSTGFVLSGEKATNELRDGFINMNFAASPPTNVVAAQLVLRGRVLQTDRFVYFDTCAMGGDEITSEAVQLRFPTNGAVYAEGNVIPFRVLIQSGISVASVKYIVTDITTAAVVNINGVSPTFGADYSTLPAAQYSVVAEATLTNGPVITTAANKFIVGEAPSLPTREYKASNSYTQLLLQNFDSLSSSMPPTAVVTGAELELSYSLKLLVRSKDKDLDELTTARYEAALAVAPSVTIAAQAMEPQGSSLVAVGTTMSEVLQLKLSDFSVIEDGTSEGKRWTVLENKATTVTIGTEGSVFGLTGVQAGNFIDYAVGIRAFPQFGSVPEWADSGDACIRVLIDRVRLRVYFDAGSVEYYFVNDGSTQEIKGTLAAVYVDTGDLKNGDGGGIMQLLPITEPNDAVIYERAAIHSASPATAKNRIGTVESRMLYNGLPTYKDVIVDNRSRYLFTTANFYGSPELNSMYGVNGVDRGFAYNGDFFYKLTTHPDPEQDKPRHVASHHGHLALGYGSGRVDLSVVGEPWNFSGRDGASSWAIGDEVTGLLALPGTMLGIFGRKSITGLSGTTVDNFATQTISPKLGAVEYTVTDMGFPVYANAYGIYTLSQTSEYGDFLGNPLSQQVSPWLRPRLVRSSSSNKEVVVAWPVRSKNQYKLAFADGYVLTMTMNYGNQMTPTFSKQKYFTTGDTDVNDFSRASLIPAAVSSELDDSGRERIHIANKQIVSDVPVLCATAPQAAWYTGADSSKLIYTFMTNTPSWLVPDPSRPKTVDIYIDFYDDGDVIPYYHDSYAEDDEWYAHGEYPVIYGPKTGKGTIYSSDMSQSVCFNWNIPGGGA